MIGILLLRDPAKDEGLDAFQKMDLQKNSTYGFHEKKLSMKMHCCILNFNLVDSLRID